MDAKNLAFQDYMDGMKYKDIAEKYGVSINTVKSWQKRNGWNRKEGAPSKKGAHKKKGVGAPKGNKNAAGNKGGGAPLGNKNAEGHGAPEGNINALKHGAYQSIYADFLYGEEKAIYDQMPGEADLESEIKLLRLKLARLLNREETFFYTMFGEKVEKDVSEEERNAGIIAISEQLEKLVKTQNQIKRRELDEDEQRARISKLRAEVHKLEADKGTGIGSVMFAGEGDLID